MSVSDNYSVRDSAGTLVGTEVIPVWKLGAYLKTTVSAIAAFVAGQSQNYSGSFTGTHTGNAVLAATAFSTAEMTETGAVPATASMVLLNNDAASIEGLIAPAAGLVRIITQKDTGTEGHIITTVGTFDGTNNTATFNAANETLVLIGVSSTRWAIVENIGAVALTAVA
jgi:hypothetical protein